MSLLLLVLKSSSLHQLGTDALSLHLKAFAPSSSSPSTSPKLILFKTIVVDLFPFHRLLAKNNVGPLKRQKNGLTERSIVQPDCAQKKSYVDQ